jgi:hypothetical protein
LAGTPKTVILSEALKKDDRRHAPNGNLGKTFKTEEGKIDRRK